MNNEGHFTDLDIYWNLLYSKYQQGISLVSSQSKNKNGGFITMIVIGFITGLFPLWIAGIILLCNANKKTKNCFESRALGYIQVMRTRTVFTGYDTLARAVGVTPDIVQQDLRLMMFRGDLPGAALDDSHRCIRLDTLNPTHFRANNNFFTPPNSTIFTTSQSSYTYVNKNGQTVQQSFQTNGNQTVQSNPNFRQAAPPPKPAPQPTPSKKPSYPPTAMSVPLDTPLKEAGAFYLGRLGDLKNQADAELSPKIGELRQHLSKLVTYGYRHPKTESQITNFLYRYLPSVLKLVTASVDFSDFSHVSSDLKQTRSNILGVLQTMQTACDRQLEQLCQSDAIDVSSDITVLENMLSQEGLIPTGLDLMLDEQQHDTTQNG